MSFTMKTALAALLLASGTAVLYAGTANLLTGDTDAELESASMTCGSWSNSSASSPKWAHDSSTGFQSRSSIKLLEYCGIGVADVKLPKGTYTFSFYAKGSVPESTGYIAMNKKDSTWSIALKNRADNPIKLTPEWKRYSYTFESDGVSACSPYYGIEKEAAWFDRFMINAGDKPLDWVPTTECMININLPKEDGNVYQLGKPVEIAIQLTKFTEKVFKAPLKAVITDFYGREQKSCAFEPKFNREGKSRHTVSFPGDQSGYFRIDVSMDGVGKSYSTFVITRPPEPGIAEAEPFVGLCSAQAYEGALKKIGVGWIQEYICWFFAEPSPGVYDFSTPRLLKKYKELGFKTQILVQSGLPDWIISPEMKATSAKLGMDRSRMLPEEKDMEAWRKYFRAAVNEMKDYVDIYELGGELDALVGLNTYYKKLDQKTIGPFAAGKSFDRVVKQMEIAEEEIRRVLPNARISGVRPSDVDATYKYIYSMEFYKCLGKKLNCFGIDCYPQPRWIGPGQPATGTEQDLAIRYRDARAVLDRHGAGSDVYIAEYGYFVDFNEIHNLKYLQTQVNRLVRSYLKARLIGMKSLHWYTARNVRLEGKRYHMGIWWEDKPLPAVAALNIVGRIVDNVKNCAEIPLHKDLGVAVFGKFDGRAAGALWSIRPDFSPAILLDSDKFLVTDVMGNEVKFPQENGKIRLALSELPYYVWRTEKREDNYGKMSSAFRNIQIEEKLPAELFFRPASASALKVYIKSLSDKKEHTGTIAFDCCGKKGKKTFTLPKGKTVAVTLPMPESGKSMDMNIRFQGKYQPYKTVYTPPEFIRIRRKSGIEINGTMDSWQGIKPMEISGKDHIHPVDHTTYDGAEDLSARLYLAHDGKNLFLAADVTDDLHFNNSSAARIWRGDSIQLGFDPEMNFIRDSNGLDSDDTVMTAALNQGQKALAVHRGPESGTLEQGAEYTIVRDSKTNRTLYQLKIPLSAIALTPQPGKAFGFNCIVYDDDTGAGADYWLFLRQGLGRNIRPDKFAVCILE